MRRAKFFTYKAKDGGYRWRLKAANGKIVGDSGESYLTRQGATAAVLRVKIICHEMVVQGV